MEYRYLTLQIGMTDRGPLERFAAAVGVGNVKGPYRSASYRPEHASVYRWSVQGCKAEQVADALTPFLSATKAEQIKLHRGESRRGCA